MESGEVLGNSFWTLESYRYIGSEIGEWQYSASNDDHQTKDELGNSLEELAENVAKSDLDRNRYANTFNTNPQEKIETTYESDGNWSQPGSISRDMLALFTLNYIKSYVNLCETNPL